MKKLGVLIIASLLLSWSCVTASQSGVVEQETPFEDEPYEQIGFFIQAGQAEKALEAFEIAQEEAPESEETKVLYATLLMSVLEIDEAERTLDSVLQENPENVDALYNLSLIEAFKGNQEEQEEKLQTVLNLDPNHSEANAAMGEMLLAERQNDEAIEYFDRSLESDGGNLVALLGRGNAFVREKEYEEAIVDLSKAIEIDPEYDYAYIDRAKALSGNDQIEEAEEDFNKAIEINPDAYFHYIDRGRLKAVLKNETEEALEDFNKAIEIDPNYFYAYVYRGGIYYEKGEIDKALADYQMLLQDRPDYYPAYSQIATLYFIKQDWASAAYFYSEAYTKEPEAINYLFLQAVSDLRADPDADVESYLRPVVDRIPRENINYHIGRTLFEPGYDGYAIRVVNDEEDPVTQARALFYFAEYYLIDGKTNTAYSYFSDIVEKRFLGYIETYIANQELKILDKE